MLNALQSFAQYYETTYNVDSGGGWFSGGTLFVGLIVFIIVVAGMWKAFEKAKKPGWAAIIPIYNFIVLLQIVGRPIWWILLYLLAIIPLVGWIVPFIVNIVVSNDASKSYGKGIGTTLLLIFIPIIGWPYLGFGDAKYKGPAGPEKATPKKKK